MASTNFDLTNAAFYMFGLKLSQQCDDESPYLLLFDLAIPTRSSLSLQSFYATFQGGTQSTGILNKFVKLSSIPLRSSVVRVV